MKSSPRTSLLLAAVLLAPPLAGQAFEEHFNFPNGTVIPGWTKEVGAWAVRNGRLFGTGKGWRFLTKNQFLAKDCVLEGTFFFAGTGVQFGGLVARHPGKGSGTNLVLGKIQDNWPGKGFDQAYLYELPQVHTYLNLKKRGTLAVVLRLILLDDQAWLKVDGDRDGVFEETLGPLKLGHVLGAGLVGLASYGPTEMDDFKFFDAVLKERAGSVPAIGKTFRMHLRAPLAKGKATPYLCLVSPTNGGIPLRARKIPLGPDPALNLPFLLPGVFQRFLGLLDSKGDAFPAIRIPNDPSLVGGVFYVAGFTIDLSKPFAVGAVSNDLRIRIR